MAQQNPAAEVAQGELLRIGDNDGKLTALLTAGRFSERAFMAYLSSTMQDFLRNKLTELVEVRQGLQKLEAEASLARQEIDKEVYEKLKAKLDKKRPPANVALKEQRIRARFVDETLQCETTFYSERMSLSVPIPASDLTRMKAARERVEQASEQRRQANEEIARINELLEMKKSDLADDVLAEILKARMSNAEAMDMEAAFTSTVQSLLTKPK